MQGGVEWKDEIKEGMDNANIFLLLISADFLASDFIYSVELKHALESTLRIRLGSFPIVLKECDWYGLPVEVENPKTGETEDFTLGRLQALPWEGKPIWGPTHSSPDSAFTKVAQGISQVVESDVRIVFRAYNRSPCNR